MDDCDRRGDSNDRQMCRNRCFNSMSGSYPGSFNKEEAIGSRNFQMSRCMDDCDKRGDSDDRQMCRNRCFDSMSGFYPGSFNKEEAIARSYGSGNFEMCMRDCDRREDSNDRQRCRNRCSESMSDFKFTNYLGESLATLESKLNIRMIEVLAIIGVIFISYSAYKRCKKSDYVNVPGMLEPEDI